MGMGGRRLHGHAVLRGVGHHRVASAGGGVVRVAVHGEAVVVGAGSLLGNRLSLLVVVVLVAMLVVGLLPVLVDELVGALRSLPLRLASLVRLARVRVLAVGLLLLTLEVVVSAGGPGHIQGSRGGGSHPLFLGVFIRHGPIKSSGKIFQLRGFLMRAHCRRFSRWQQ